MKIRIQRVRVVVVKVFLFNVKILKFLQIFVLVCFFYLFAYITYTILSTAKYVDYYCIPSVLFLLFIVYWFVVGVTFPQNLPFFKMNNRLLVAIISLISILALCGILILIETHVYKRPAVQNIVINGRKVFAMAKKTDPLGQKFKEIN